MQPRRPQHSDVSLSHYSRPCPRKGSAPRDREHLVPGSFSNQFLRPHQTRLFHDAQMTSREIVPPTLSGVVLFCCCRWVHHSFFSLPPSIPKPHIHTHQHTTQTRPLTLSESSWSCTCLCRYTLKLAFLYSHNHHAHSYTTTTTTLCACLVHILYSCFTLGISTPRRRALSWFLI